MADDHERNIYFGTCLRSDRQGDEEHAAVLTALWADLDFKDFGGDEQAAARLLAAFEFPPSIIIHSGNGFHVYWLFREPEEITPENRPYLRGLLLGIAESLGGDRSCRDLSRVLRVPGSIWAKREGKVCMVRDCPNPRPVRVLRWHPERRYNPIDFEPYYIEDKPSAAHSVDLGDIPDQLPAKFIQALEQDSDLRDAWEGRRIPPRDQSRSGFDAMLAAMLVNRGYSDTEAAAILHQYAHGKGREASRAYLERTIRHARDFAEPKLKHKSERATAPFSLTDDGNADRLIARHGQDLRFCPEVGWMYWDGRRWVEDRTGEVRRRAVETAKGIGVEAAREPDPERGSQLFKFAGSCLSHTRLKAMIESAESKHPLPVFVGEFDQDPFLLNIPSPNGFCGCR